MSSASADGTIGRILRSAGVLSMFAAVGPAAGGLLVFCCIYPLLLMLGFDRSGEAVTQSSPIGTSPVAFLESLGLFVAAGYAFAGVQALLAGAWAAVFVWLKGSVSYKLVIAGTIVATLVWLAMVVSPLNPIGSGDAGEARKITTAVQIAVALLPIAIVSAVACRWLCAKAGLLREG